MTTDPLSRFAPAPGESVSLRAFAWRSEPPTVDEVDACRYWWNREPGRDPRLAVLDVDHDERVVVLYGHGDYDPEPLASVNWEIGVEWMPCVPSESKDSDAEEPGPPPEVLAAAINEAMSGPRKRLERGQIREWIESLPMPDASDDTDLEASSRGMSVAEIVERYPSAAENLMDAMQDAAGERRRMLELGQIAINPPANSTSLGDVWTGTTKPNPEAFARFMERLVVFMSTR